MAWQFLQVQTVSIIEGVTKYLSAMEWVWLWHFNNFLNCVRLWHSWIWLELPSSRSKSL